MKHLLLEGWEAGTLFMASEKGTGWILRGRGFDQEQCEAVSAGGGSPPPYPAGGHAPGSAPAAQPLPRQADIP